MDNIIGRKYEKNELELAYVSNNSEFIAVYVRRRVGKTFLIKNFFQAKKCVYFQMTGIYKGSLSKQLTRFAKEIGDTFYRGASIKVPINWMDAFEELLRAISQIPKNIKIVLFFDELPGMATRKSGVISAIEYFWNRYWTSDKRIKLIVCGSAASWIIKKIINNRGGLHNRVTRKIRLLPFNLYDTFLYLKHIGYDCNYQQAAKLYMVMGGIPFYLNQINKNISIDKNIDKLFYDSNSVLFAEFNEVFASLFENAEQYKELILIIAKNKDGVSRNLIKEKNKLTGHGGRLTKRLEDLENAGFVSSFMSYGHHKKGVSYRITDEYCYFYFRWVRDKINSIKQNKATKYWADIINTPEYYNWLDSAFENLCYKHVAQLKKAIDIGESAFASPWRYIPRKGSTEQGAQIDLLFDCKDSIIICEMKYTDQPFEINKSYAERIRQKISVFKKVDRINKQTFFVMITANNIKNNDYSEDLVNKVVTLEDLYEKD